LAWKVNTIEMRIEYTIPLLC